MSCVKLTSLEDIGPTISTSKKDGQVCECVGGGFLQRSLQKSSGLSRKDVQVLRERERDVPLFRRVSSDTDVVRPRQKASQNHMTN